MDTRLSNGWRVVLVVRSNTNNLYLYDEENRVVLAKQYAYWQHSLSIAEYEALVSFGTVRARRIRKAA